MLGRLLISLAVILLAFAAIWSFSRFFLRRRAKRGLGIAEIEVGRPAVLYFTTPDCLPCRTVQRPALHSLQEHFGERIQIITVDAYQNPKLADAWGVLSVPTTFIIDHQGRPRGVNHGVARYERLKSQLEKADQTLTNDRVAALLDPHNQIS